MKSIDQSEITVGLWRQEDIPEVLALMWQLARFEGYDNQFKVTEQDLLERGFGEQVQFDCIVARANRSGLSTKQGEIVGYAVLVYTPFTYDLKPAATLKEFLVKECVRGYGIGQKLFTYMAQYCAEKGVERLSWLVLQGNSKAETFYQGQGGALSKQWLLYEKSLG